MLPSCRDDRDRGVLSRREGQHWWWSLSTSSVSPVDSAIVGGGDCRRATASDEVAVIVDERHSLVRGVGSRLLVGRLD
jgi:hypothetical protein